ncbi:hypothetical protein HALLA_08120 [Halostagnicola larsenii XH-48]|uniref:Profilin fold domain-containing protein n=1 Tax=Halostagnicola larsenii XH-48 TaxID=797299 RepID=W0JJR7_9EURY|nr:hypothetical protein [Halostagnicola larsenii]AHF98833.1 hypothetical protein HALLA_08120 [Halostagnicola larsenii XH-48]
MTDGTGKDVATTEEITKRRDEVVARVRSHAGQIARELALLQGGDYGQEAIETANATWTVKYEAGDIQYLRFDPNSGEETYVISTKQPPEPDALERAMDDYGAFIDAYNEYVASFDDVLVGVPDEFPAIESAADLVAERDRIVRQIHDVATEMAGQLQRYDGEYGTYSTTISGTRWELKWDGSEVSYLRVGGSDGTYLLSQYGPPSASELRRLAPDVEPFVESFNAEIADLEADLDRVSLRKDE